MKGKKLIVFFLTLSFCLCFFVGCKNVSIEDISKNLTNYTLNLTFDDASRTLKGEQKVDYINSTEVALNEVWFHLYPNAFSKEAKNKPVSLSYKEKAYPNGENFGGITIDSVYVEQTEKQVNVGEVDNEILKVDLNKELFPDERVEILLTYTVIYGFSLHSSIC